ncbi:MAG TPA: hypothetical protein VME17_02320 [Bryobacteraceae bacterium]|nr:hypothetical protein [Bryobacteraceae bacterium]
MLLIVVGCVWFLQGINVLPGSFMTGKTQWVVYRGVGVLVEPLYGGVAVVVGIVLLVGAAKRRTLKG